MANGFGFCISSQSPPEPPRRVGLGPRVQDREAVMGEPPVSWPAWLPPGDGWLASLLGKLRVRQLGKPLGSESAPAWI